MKKMSITRALAELKLLDKRISKSIGQAKFVTFAKDNSKDVVRGLSKEDYNKEAKATLQSIKDLIERRSKIASAIAISNATQDIDVAGKKYKVVEAITRKNNIQHEEELLGQLKSQLANANYNIENNNKNVNDKLQQILLTMVGKDNAKNMTEETIKISEQYRKDNEYSLVDGLGAEKLISEMEKEIDEFMFEIDFALSTNNSLTEIEI